jgi:hypothetical protein
MTFSKHEIDHLVHLLEEDTRNLQYCIVNRVGEEADQHARIRRNDEIIRKLREGT